MYATCPTLPRMTRAPSSSPVTRQTTKIFEERMLEVAGAEYDFKTASADDLVAVIKSLADT